MGKDPVISFQISAADVRKIIKWFAGVLITGLGLQTAYLHVTTPSQKEIYARQDSLHQIHTSHLAAMAEILDNRNEQHANRIIQFLQDPVLMDLAEIQNQVDDISHSIGTVDQHLGHEINRARLQWLVELDDMKRLSSRPLVDSLKITNPKTQDDEKSSSGNGF